MILQPHFCKLMKGHDRFVAAESIPILLSKNTEFCCSTIISMKDFKIGLTWQCEQIKVPNGINKARFARTAVLNWSLKLVILIVIFVKFDNKKIKKT